MHGFAAQVARRGAGSRRHGPFGFRSLALLVALLNLGGVARVAVGAPSGGAAAEPAACSPQAAEAARQHNRTAAAWATRGRLSEAFEQLTFAYKLCSEPKVLLNMARLSAAMGRDEDAYDAYRAFLASGAEPALRPRAEQALATVENALGTSRGRLVVQCEPPDAEVTVARLEPRAGGKPFERWLLPGTHEVQVAAPGYEPATQAVAISRGVTTRLQLALKPAFLGGTLSIDTSPIGARVALDERFVGLAPLRDYAVAPGSHTLRVEHPGFLPFRAELSVGSREAKSVEAVLLPDPAAGPPVPAPHEPGAATRDREPRPSRRPLRAWGYATLAVGLAAAAGGGGANLYAHLRGQDVGRIDAHQSDAAISREYAAIRNDYDTGMAAAYGLYGGGAAFCITGAVLLIVDAATTIEPRPPPPAGAAFTPSTQRN